MEQELLEVRVYPNELDIDFLSLLKKFGVPVDLRKYIIIKEGEDGYCFLVKLIAGERLSLQNGAMAQRLSKPFYKPTNKSKERLRLYYYISLLFRLAKSKLRQFCPLEDYCLANIAGSAPKKNKKREVVDEWWGFSCGSCPFKKTDNKSVYFEEALKYFSLTSNWRLVEQNLIYAL